MGSESSDIVFKPLKRDPPEIHSSKKKKKRSRVNFQGDEFVKETGLNPFESRQDTIIKIRGHAEVTSSNIIMRAPLIEIYGDDSHLAWAKGPVELKDKKSGAVLSANEALYIRSENRAVMRGRAKLVYTPRNKNAKTARTTVTLNASEIDRHFDVSESEALGNVTATDGKAVFYAKKARFIERENLIESDSEPRIFVDQDLFYSDKMNWQTDKNIARFTGNVRAYFSAQNGQNKRAVSSTDTSAVKAGKGELVMKDDPAEQVIILEKNVSIERKDFAATADKANIKGAGGDVIKGFGRVFLHNKVDRTQSRGDYLEFVKETGFGELSANKGNTTQTILFDKKNQPQSELYAMRLTRATTHAHPQARGNVVLKQVGTKGDTARDQGNLGSEWAEIRQDEKLIQFYGRPYVEGKVGRVYAREIILYYEEARFEMSGISTGQVLGVDK